MEQKTFIPTNYKDVRESDFLDKGDVITLDLFGDGIQRKFKVMKIDNYVATLLSLEDKTYNDYYEREHKGLVVHAFYYNKDEGDSYLKAPFYNDFGFSAITPDVNPLLRYVYDNGIITRFSGGYNLDYFTNTIIYNKLSTQIKNAIIDTDIDQYLYVFNRNVSKNTQIPSNWQNFVKIPTYLYVPGEEPSNDYYQTINAYGKINIGSRHIYAPSITDFLEYFGLSPEDTNTDRHELTNEQMNEIFPEDPGLIYSYTPPIIWLRDVEIMSEDFRFNITAENYGITIETDHLDDFPQEPQKRETAKFWHGPTNWQERCRFMFKIDLSMIPIHKVTE